MPSQNIGVFNIDSLFVLFGPKRIQGWPASGNVISCAKARAEEVAAVEGVDGEVTVYKSTGRLYTCSLTLMRSAAANGYLWEVLRAQRESKTIPFLPFSVSYEANQMASARACISAHPPYEFGADSLGDATWTLLLLGFDGLFRGISIDGNAFTVL
jgi:hypothetical protein